MNLLSECCNYLQGIIDAEAILLKELDCIKDSHINRYCERTILPINPERLTTSSWDVQNKYYMAMNCMNEIEKVIETDIILAAEKDTLYEYIKKFEKIYDERIDFFSGFMDGISEYIISGSSGYKPNFSLIRGRIQMYCVRTPEIIDEIYGLVASFRKTDDWIKRLRQLLF